MKIYTVKEFFLTLQCEGANSGRRAVFCRFAGCNLWSGLEKDRATAVCQFCDTDFIGTDGENGGRYYASILAAKAKELWGDVSGKRFIVLTGGEPMLQVDHLLIDTLHRFEFEVAIETNGTIAVPYAMDWICVSPKAGAELVQTLGQEIKVVFPQEGAEPERYADLDFRHHFLSPMDGPDREANTQAAVRYCLDHPKWRLSLQIHKLVGVK